MKLYGNDNPHPQGVIGEAYANMLLRAGWTEKQVDGYEDFWVSPENNDIGPLRVAVRYEEMRRKVGGAWIKDDAND